jgi:arylsulfatase A-like enzyme
MRMDDRHAVGRFIQWIAARNDPRPFYCGFYLQSPHFNYEVPEPWASHYQPVPPLYSNGDGILHIPADVLPKLKNQYDNALRYADHFIGQIVDALATAGVLDRTIIIAVGDHGEGFMEHGLARHGVHTWEEMIHIPLIIWLGPELRAACPRPLPSIVASTVSGLDVAPTLAALVDLPPHPSWQGLNVLDPAYTSRDRPVFSMTQYTRWQETACLDGLKYLYDLTEAREFLFDLRADPGEQHNLARSNPALAAAMRQLLAGWHTYQLAYYAVPNRPAYVGRYQPDPATLDAIHHAAGR